jgi:nicotinamidase-related amidase
MGPIQGGNVTDQNLLSLASATTALVVIDLQKGIVSRATEPLASGVVVANAARLADAQRARGGFVVLVRVSYSPDLRDALHPVSDDPVRSRSWAPPADFAELVPELGPRPGDHIVTKRQWGAFYGTDLDLQLRRRGITTLVLCGISTCFGVESTARDAFERGYQQVFVEDAMAAMSTAEHLHTVTRIFPRLGRVRRSADLLAALA